MTIILASASPRRRVMLQTLGLVFEVVPSTVSEDRNLPEDPNQAAELLAKRKAQAVAGAFESGAIIGADTVVVLGTQRLGKPVDRADASATLGLLRNKIHRVVTGLAVIDGASGHVKSGVVTTKVKMRDYSESQIAEYVASKEPRDKAGSYAIQGLGGSLVEWIDGCYNNVVGLPLCEMCTMLDSLGYTTGAGRTVCSLPSGEACPRLQV